MPAVGCNEFVFVAGQTAHDPGTGLDPRVVLPVYSAWAGTSIRKQTEFLILEKLRSASKRPGSNEREICVGVHWEMRKQI